MSNLMVSKASILILLLFTTINVIGQVGDTIFPNTKFTIEITKSKKSACEFRISNIEIIDKNYEFFETQELIDTVFAKNEVRGLLQHRNFEDSTWTYIIFQNGYVRPLEINYRKSSNMNSFEDNINNYVIKLVSSERIMELDKYKIEYLIITEISSKY